jgi:putative RNA 2'-phosphotransferase
MFLKLDENAACSDSLLGTLIKNSIDGYQDAMLVFRDYIFVVLKEANEDSEDTFSYGLFKIKKQNEAYDFEGVFIKEGIYIKCFKDIAHRFKCDMRELYPELIVVDFPFEEMIIGLVSDFEEHLSLFVEKKSNKENGISNQSKILAEILRHDPYKHGLTITPTGWVTVSSINDKVKQLSTYSIIEKIVMEDEKSRYAFNKDKTMVRANQGHSLKDVSIDYKRIYPTEALFHGTTPDIENILLIEGLKPMNRHYVHLSGDIATAHSVGKRYSKKKDPIIFKIQNFNDMEIYISDNGVYLTKSVAPELLNKIKYSI